MWGGSISRVQVGMRYRLDFVIKVIMPLSVLSSIFITIIFTRQEGYPSVQGREAFTAYYWPITELMHIKTHSVKVRSSHYPLISLMNGPLLPVSN